MSKSNRESRPGKVTPRSTKFCPHCEQFLTKSTYYRHRTEFYNPITKTWDKQKRTLLPRRDKTTNTDDFEMEQDNMHVGLVPDHPELDPKNEGLSSSLLGRQNSEFPTDSGMYSYSCMYN